MWRPGVILLVSWAYVGCSAPRSPPLEVPQARPGGVARVVVGETLGLPELRRWVADVALVPASGRPGLSTMIDPPPGGPSSAGCWQFDVRRTSDMDSPTAGTVLQQWRQALTEPADVASVLLARVVSPGASMEAVEAAAADPDAPPAGLRLCVPRPTPDLLRRLAHPALWLSQAGSGAARGPFAVSDDDPRFFPRNPHGTGPPPLEALRAVEAADADPALLLRLGEADVALLYGPSAAALIQRPAESLRLERWPAMDRVYWIRFHLGQRWVRDPTFRRWLAGRLPRESLLRYVFDERGETSYTLSRQEPRQPRWDPVMRRPFSAATRPRLSLDYPGHDRFAAAIAGRLQASLELEGLSVAIHERSLEELTAEGFDGASSMALMCHRPRSEDPVLALLETVGPLGPRAGPFLALLDQASRLEQTTDRRAAAWLAEDALLIDADIAPLVRVQAWLASHRALQGLVAAADGMPRFDLAWWER